MKCFARRRFMSKYTRWTVKTSNKLWWRYSQFHSCSSGQVRSILDIRMTNISFFSYITIHFYRLHQLSSNLNNSTNKCASNQRKNHSRTFCKQFSAKEVPQSSITSIAWMKIFQNHLFNDKKGSLPYYIKNSNNLSFRIGLAAGYLPSTGETNGCLARTLKLSVRPSGSIAPSIVVTLAASHFIRIGCGRALIGRSPPIINMYQK